MTNEIMSFQIVRVGELICFVGDTRSNWIETYGILDEAGVEYKSKHFSDYNGPHITSDMILYYSDAIEECPSVINARWMFN